MSDLLTFFDVETPNRRNDRVCSIAIVQTDPSGLVVERRSWLVDPETSFDDVNMRIHGIAPVSVRGERTLPEIWDDELRSLISGTRLVAHNAKFDLSFLKCVGVEPKKDAVITDTMAEYAAFAKVPRVNGRGFRSFKLTEAAEAVGHQWTGKAHGSLADAQAALAVQDFLDSRAPRASA